MNTPIPPDHLDASSFPGEGSDTVRDGFFTDLQARPAVDVRRSEHLWAAIAQEAQLPDERFSRPALLRLWPVWAAAATVALLIGVGVVLFGPTSMVTYEVAFGQPALEVQLDGDARAILRPGSRVEAVAAPEGRIAYRVVRGEAWFDVDHRPERVFEVHAADVHVEVLGTAFSVRATPDEARVALERGRVRVHTDSDTLYLAPGQGATSVGQSLSEMPAQEVQPMLQWRTGTLDIHHTPLAVVLAELEQQYGIRLEVGAGLAQTSISGKLVLDVRPESTLHALSTSLGAQFEATPRGFRLVQR